MTKKDTDGAIPMTDETAGKLVVFKGKQIRRVLPKGEWFFAVVDIIEALTDSDNPRDYWYRMKRREQESTGIELSTFCRQLKILSSDGKKYATEAANAESIFRIIQSIPSPKAEPFKRWLAKVGYERVQEIENPELAQGGGKIARNARRELESKSGRKVVSKENFLPEQRKIKCVRERKP